MLRGDGVGANVPTEAEIRVVERLAEPFGQFELELGLERVFIRDFVLRAGVIGDDVGLRAIFGAGTIDSLA